MEILKKVGIGLLIVIVLFGGAFGGYYLANKRAQAVINDYKKQVADLQNKLNAIGELVPAYKLNVDVSKMQEIKSSDLTIFYVPKSLSNLIVNDINQLKNSYYKMDLKAGELLMKSYVTTEEIKDNERLYDIVLDEIPIGLKVGDYVDIRISMPFGEDFIGMSKKRVYDIYGKILKLKVNEMDLHTYNSMLIDKILYPGTRIYATLYIEPGLQKEAQIYYPVSKNVFTILSLDPNLLEKVKQGMLNERSNLETSLKSAINPQIAEILRYGKTSITQEMEKEREEFKQRMKQQSNQQPNQQNSGAIHWN